jgi:hypothetical protein
MGRSNNPEGNHSSFADRRTGMRTGSKAEGDQAKTQTYCEIQKLTQQMEQAYEKNDSKKADELSETHWKILSVPNMPN